MGNCDGSYELLEEEKQKTYIDVKRKEGAVRYFGTDSIGDFVVGLYDQTIFKLNPDSELCDKLVIDQRFEFVYYKDKNTKIIIDIKDPKVYTFKATVASIWPMDMIDPECNVDNDPIYDVVDGVTLKRYEIYFLSGGPGKLVYVLEGMHNKLEVGHFYIFNCVIDNGDRSRWYKVISVTQILTCDNLTAIEAQRFQDGQFAYEEYIEEYKISNLLKDDKP